MDIVCAFGWLEAGQQLSDALPETVNGSLFCLSQKQFELGKDLLDGVQVRRVCGQEEQVCTCGPDHTPDLVALMACEVVHDNDIAGLERGDQNLFDIGLEAHSVDRAIKNKRCGDSVAAKGCQEGRCLPVAIGQFGQEGLAPGAPAMGSGHVGLCPGFINEHKAAGLE